MIQDKNCPVTTHEYGWAKPWVCLHDLRRLVIPVWDVLRTPWGIDMTDTYFRFRDRSDAGRKLAARLLALSIDEPVVYALPRGGVPVALEIARALSAPLDLVLVRKIGAPGAPELALGALVEGQSPETVINEDVMLTSRAGDTFLTRAREQELQELERRRSLYLGDRPRIDPTGHTAIIVDDGLATGATAKAALIALKRRGASRTILAVPVAPKSTVDEMATNADLVVCLHPAEHFTGVGAFYGDFHQLSDAETIGLLHQSWSEQPDASGLSRQRSYARPITVLPRGLVGDLRKPANPRGLVLFAHGSGSSRLSPRNIAVAEALHGKGFATLLLDLLTPQEAKDRRNVFDIPLLAERLVETALWISGEPDLADLPLGLFGASTGAGAAMLAAAELRGRVAAIVSRGGRPDLAAPRLAEVEAPSLLIVGANDEQVLDLNRRALAMLRCEKLLRVVPDAGHLFEEPGALETVTEMASAWFQHYLAEKIARPAPAAAARPPRRRTPC